MAALKCRRSPSPDRVRQCGAQVLDEANARVSDCPDRPCETFKERRQQLVDALQAFDECVSWVVVWVAALRARELSRCGYREHRAPFTLQRLCEILLEPDRQYKSTNKLVAGIDKVRRVCDGACACTVF